MKMPVASDKEDFWRKIINELDVEDLPEEGKVPIELEPKRGKVQVQKVTTTVYIMYDTISRRKFSHQATMEVKLLGEMEYDEAQKLLNRGIDK